jgi:hypothetical protein
MTKRNMQPYITAVAGVVIVTLSELASAQATSTAVSSSSSRVEVDSTAATQLISVTSLRQMLAISNALTARAMARLGPPPLRSGDSGQHIGLAAGQPPEKWNVWGSLSGDNNKYNDGTNLFTAKAVNTVLGGDYTLAPTLNLGLSAAFDRTDGNAGTTAANTSFNSSGTTLAPYLGWQINNDWSLDATAGWGKGDLTTGGASGNNKRLFYGTNLNYIHWYGNWQGTGKASYLHGEEKFDNSPINGNVGTKNKIDQYRLGAQVGYWMNGTMPYAGLAYASDSRSTSFTGTDLTANLGKTATIWTLGVNFISLQNKLTAGVAYNAESGRSNSKSDTLLATIGYRF